MSIINKTKILITFPSAETDVKFEYAEKFIMQARNEITDPFFKKERLLFPIKAIIPTANSRELKTNI